MREFKHILITGANGTLAPYIIEHARRLGIKVTIWNRDKVSIDDQNKINDFIKAVKPDAFYHIATGDPEWIRKIIIGIRAEEIPFIFTSTESVFADFQNGAFSEDVEALSESDYGKYKRECENIVRSEYGHNSYIVRLGWQIGLIPEKNNMLAWMKANNPVHASNKWIPSTSFMPDTAQALLEEIIKLPFGTYHLDGNNEDMTFYEIAKALNEAFKLGIDVIEDNNFIRNNRLLSEKLHVKSISKRL